MNKGPRWLYSVYYMVEIFRKPGLENMQQQNDTKNQTKFYTSD